MWEVNKNISDAISQDFVDNLNDLEWKNYDKLTSRQKRKLAEEVYNQLNNLPNNDELGTPYEPMIEDFKKSLSEIEVNTKQEKEAISNIVEIISKALDQLGGDIEIYYKEDSYLNFENYDVKEFWKDRIKSERKAFKEYFGQNYNAINKESFIASILDSSKTYEWISWNDQEKNQLSDLQSNDKFPAFKKIHEYWFWVRELLNYELILKNLPEDKLIESIFDIDNNGKIDEWEEADLYEEYRDSLANDGLTLYWLKDDPSLKYKKIFEFRLQEKENAEKNEDIDYLENLGNFKIKDFSREKKAIKEHFWTDLNYINIESFISIYDDLQSWFSEQELQDKWYKWNSSNEQDKKIENEQLRILLGNKETKVEDLLKMYEYWFELKDLLNYELILEKLWDLQFPNDTLLMSIFDIDNNGTIDEWEENQLYYQYKDTIKDDFLEEVKENPIKKYEYLSSKLTSGGNQEYTWVSFKDVDKDDQLKTVDSNRQSLRAFKKWDGEFKWIENEDWTIDKEERKAFREMRKSFNTIKDNISVFSNMIKDCYDYDEFNERLNNLDSFEQKISDLEKKYYGVDVDSLVKNYTEINYSSYDDMIESWYIPSWKENEIWQISKILKNERSLLGELNEESKIFSDLLNLSKREKKALQNLAEMYYKWEIEWEEMPEKTKWIFDKIIAWLKNDHTLSEIFEYNNIVENLDEWDINNDEYLTSDEEKLLFLLADVNNDGLFIESENMINESKRDKRKYREFRDHSTIAWSQIYQAYKNAKLGYDYETYWKWSEKIVENIKSYLGNLEYMNEIENIDISTDLDLVEDSDDLLSFFLEHRELLWLFKKSLQARASDTSACFEWESFVERQENIQTKELLLSTENKEEIYDLLDEETKEKIENEIREKYQKSFDSFYELVEDDPNWSDYLLQINNMKEVSEEKLKLLSMDFVWMFAWLFNAKQIAIPTKNGIKQPEKLINETNVTTVGGAFNINSPRLNEFLSNSKVIDSINLNVLPMLSDINSNWSKDTQFNLWLSLSASWNQDLWKWWSLFYYGWANNSIADFKSIILQAWLWIEKQINYSKMGSLDLKSAKYLWASVSTWFNKWILPSVWIGVYYRISQKEWLNQQYDLLKWEFNTFFQELLKEENITKDLIVQKLNTKYWNNTNSDTVNKFAKDVYYMLNGYDGDMKNEDVRNKVAERMSEIFALNFFNQKAEEIEKDWIKLTGLSLNWFLNNIYPSIWFQFTKNTVDMVEQDNHTTEYLKSWIAAELVNANFSDGLEYIIKARGLEPNSLKKETKDWIDFVSIHPSVIGTLNINIANDVQPFITKEEGRLLIPDILDVNLVMLNAVDRDNVDNRIIVWSTGTDWTSALTNFENIPEYSDESWNYIKWWNIYQQLSYFENANLVNELWIELQWWKVMIPKKDNVNIEWGDWENDYLQVPLTWVFKIHKVDIAWIETYDIKIENWEGLTSIEYSGEEWTSEVADAELKIESLKDTVDSEVQDYFDDWRSSEFILSFRNKKPDFYKKIENGKYLEAANILKNFIEGYNWENPDNWNNIISKFDKSSDNLIWNLRFIYGAMSRVSFTKYKALSLWDWEVEKELLKEKWYELLEALWKWNLNSELDKLFDSNSSDTESAVARKTILQWIWAGNFDLNNLYSVKNTGNLNENQKNLIYMIVSVQNIINTRTTHFETRLRGESEWLDDAWRNQIITARNGLLKSDNNKEQTFAGSTEMGWYVGMVFGYGWEWANQHDEKMVHNPLRIEKYNPQELTDPSVKKYFLNNLKDLDNWEANVLSQIRDKMVEDISSKLDKETDADKSIISDFINNNITDQNFYNIISWNSISDMDLSELYSNLWIEVPEGKDVSMSINSPEFFFTFFEDCANEMIAMWPMDIKYNIIVKSGEYNESDPDVTWKFYKTDLNTVSKTHINENNFSIMLAAWEDEDKEDVDVTEPEQPEWHTVVLTAEEVVDYLGATSGELIVDGEPVSVFTYENQIYTSTSWNNPVPIYIDLDWNYTFNPVIHTPEIKPQTQISPLPEVDVNKKIKDNQDKYVQDVKIHSNNQKSK